MFLNQILSYRRRSEKLARLLAPKVIGEKDGPFEVVAGIFTGFVIFLGMTGLKILVSMALQNQKYVPLILGLADIGLGAAIIYDVVKHPKTDFWKGANWTFGILDIIQGVVTIVSPPTKATA